MSAPTALDDLLMKLVENNGTLVPTRSALNFKGFTVTDNPSNDSTDVSSTGSSSSVTGTGFLYAASGVLNSAAVGFSGDVALSALSGGNVPTTVQSLTASNVTLGTTTIAPSVDAHGIFGTSAKRLFNVVSNKYQVFAASGDTQAATTLVAGALFFGAGGSSGPDMELVRLGTKTLGITATKSVFASGSGTDVSGNAYNVPNPTSGTLFETIALADLTCYQFLATVQIYDGAGNTYVADYEFYYQRISGAGPTLVTSSSTSPVNPFTTGTTTSWGLTVGVSSNNITLTVVGPASGTAKITLQVF